MAGRSMEASDVVLVDEDPVQLLASRRVGIGGLMSASCVGARVPPDPDLSRLTIIGQRSGTDKEHIL
jgi:hypothetical protein